MANTSIKIHRSLILLLGLLGVSLRTLAQDCSQMASDYRQSVVSLSVEKTKKETGAVSSSSGTGFIVSEEGYVLTTHHLVSRDPDTESVMVEGAIGSLYGSKLPLKLVAVDKDRDIALLAFRDDSRSYKPIRLGNPFRVAIGGQLCSLSFSAPLQADYQATTGTLSSRTGQDVRAGVTYLWTTQMPSNLGESGAPVLNISTGGVVALKYGGKPPNQAQNVNYLVPINMAHTMLKEYCNVIIPLGEDNAAAIKPEPTLQSLHVRFLLSESDDKDFDTKVAISVIKGNSIVGSNYDIAPNITFSDPGTHGPYSIDVQPSITKAIYSNSVVNFFIIPVGNDTWSTSISLEAKFSDNSIITNVFGPVTVSQDLRHVQFKIP